MLKQVTQTYKTSCKNTPEQIKNGPEQPRNILDQSPKISQKYSTSHTLGHQSTQLHKHIIPDQQHKTSWTSHVNTLGHQSTQVHKHIRLITQNKLDYHTTQARLVTYADDLSQTHIPITIAYQLIQKFYRLSST